MPRLLFEKTGQAVWMSHLDLMRLFQRAFKRAGLPLTHTHGFNPRPSVSIAMPLSVGVESCCELLDFDLTEDSFSCGDILSRLNNSLVAGVHILDVYENGDKIKNLAFLDCSVVMEYDNGVSEETCQKIRQLFCQESLTVEKKNKNGITQQDIIPMIPSLTIERTDSRTLTVNALVCCQNPSLNPMQIPAAITKYLPECAPDFAKCRRNEIYNQQKAVFR